MEIVLETATPDGVRVVLPALVYAKVLEEHAAVADLDLIDRTIRSLMSVAPIRDPVVSGFYAASAVCWCSSLLSSARFLRSSLRCSRLSPNRADMAIATVHISAADLELSGSYERLGDVLYLSAPADDKSAAVQETPEGHAVRLDTDGHITHLTAINAKWLLDRDGELVATLRDGRLLRLTKADVADVID